MNMKKWLEECLKKDKKKAMPILSFPAVQLTGITVEDLIHGGEIQAKAMKAVADRVDSLSSVSMMDLSVEAEAFGSQILVSDGEVPCVINKIVETKEDVEKLVVPEVGAGRTGGYIEAIKKACEIITDRPVFAGVIGPYSLAGRLMGETETMMNCFDEPETVNMLLDKATEFICSYIGAYKQTGAGGVVMAEPLAGLLSPSLAEEFSVPFVKRIVDRVQDDDFIVIYHNCGNNCVHAIDAYLSIGAAAYHFGNAIDMKEMLSKVPSDIPVMGNIDPASQFRNGTAESIYEATMNLLKECSSYKNFIISSGCDIPPLSKWENIDSFFKAVSDFYA